jgi:hypothetical protein
LITRDKRKTERLDRKEEERNRKQEKGETQRELTYFGNVLGVRALPGIQLDHSRQEKHRKTNNKT